MSSALELVSRYVAALQAGDYAAMRALCADDFVLDLVPNDAFDPGQNTDRFWPLWLAAFPHMDYQVTRTIAAEQVVVTQWTFTGTQSGPLGPPAFAKPIEPSGRTVRLRGVTVYDVGDGRIRRETMYVDHATLWVELGVA